MFTILFLHFFPRERPKKFGNANGNVNEKNFFPKNTSQIDKNKNLARVLTNFSIRKNQFYARHTSQIVKKLYLACIKCLQKLQMRPMQYKQHNKRTSQITKIRYLARALARISILTGYFEANGTSQIAKIHNLTCELNN